MVAFIASVITVATLVHDGIKLGKSLYRASEEFDALLVIQARSANSAFIASLPLMPSLNKDQTESFLILVNEIKIQPVDSLSTAICKTLSRARYDLEQVNHILQAKVLRNVDGTSRARRRAWARDKSKIYKIREALKEHRLDLMAAMGARECEYCSSLYDKGVYCYNTEHFLMDMRKIGSWVVPGKYHFCVKSSGKRDVVEL